MVGNRPVANVVHVVDKRPVGSCQVRGKIGDCAIGLVVWDARHSSCEELVDLKTGFC